jgi:hypothetical protein
MQRRWAPQLSSRSIEQSSSQPVGGEPSTGAASPKIAQKAAVMLYLAFIRMTQRSLCAAQRPRERRRQSAVWQRACGGETGAAGQARVEQRAGAPQQPASAARLQSTASGSVVRYRARLSRCLCDCAASAWILEESRSRISLGPRWSQCCSRVPGQAHSTSPNAPFPWVMSLLARAPRLLFPPNLSLPHPHLPLLHRAVPPFLYLCQMLCSAALC